MPNCAEARNNLGYIYAQSRQYAAAEAELLLATKLQAGSPDAHFNLGLVLAETSRPLGAAAAYRRAIDLKPDYAEAHNKLGTILACAGRASAAATSFRQALDLQPEFAEARVNLEKALEATERLGETEAAYRAELASAPDSAAAHLKFGRFLLELERLPEAEAIVRRALELTPDDAKACYSLGIIFQDTKRLFEAEQAYRRTLDLMPDFAEAHNALGSVLAKTRRLSDAEESFQHAIALMPDYAAAHNNLGMVFAKTGRPHQAEASFRAAVLADPLCEDAHNDLQKVIQEMQRLSGLEMACRRDLAFNAEGAKSWRSLSKTLMALGRLEEAAAGFKQALLLEPDFAAVQNDLGTVYLRQGKIDDAIACFRAALSMQEDFAPAMSDLGAAFFIKEDIAAAVTWNQAALAIDPAHVDANQNLALISLRTGNLQEAKRYFDSAAHPASLSIERALHPVRAVLILGTVRKGNISPWAIEFIFPGNINTRISWLMEYAANDRVDNLPEYDLVFNAMGDPDMTGDVSRPLDRFLQACTKPLLNHPDKVRLTARHNLPRLLAGIPGLLVPEVCRVGREADWNNAIFAAPPLLVRPANTHGGDGVVLVRTAAELAELRRAQALPAYAIRFVDFRSADSWFRKYRIIFVDREPYPCHLAISPHWMVHYVTAEMESHPWKLAEEKKFLEDPAAVLGATGLQAIRAIAERLDLDYAGIDFSIMADGRLLVFEANTMMLAHPENLYGPLAHKNVFVYRIADRIEQMLNARMSSAT